MLTPNDIRNPARKSGFDHVGKNDTGGKNRKPFQADVYGGTNDKAGRQWKGPRRATAREAAQDYCNYVNGGGRIPRATRNRSTGHAAPQRAALPRDPEVEAALGVLRDARGAREGRQGYVYLIIEVLPGGGIDAGKIGYSTNPRARVTELQVGNPRKLRLLYAMPGTEDDERRLHVKYADQNILLEWFHVTAEMILEFPVETRVTDHKEAKAA